MRLTVAISAGIPKDWPSQQAESWRPASQPPSGLAAILRRRMPSDIDPMGTRRDGLDAFLDEKLAEGFAVETRTDTHAVIFRRAKGLRRLTGGGDPGRFVVEVDEDGRATMRQAEPRRS